MAWSNHQNNMDGGNMSLVTCSDDACHKIWRIGSDELPDDEKVMLRGHAERQGGFEFLRSRHPKLSKKVELLDSTPRSLKRLIEQSETTPSTSSATNDLAMNSPQVLSSSRKRNYFEMNGDEPCVNGSDKKRPNIDPRGRRLFSPAEPSTSLGLQGDICYFDDTTKTLTTILEELDSPASRNFHNLSPSPAKRQLNIIKSPENVRFNRFESPMLPKVRKEVTVNSPTTNLPNFIVDGDAPHLGLMSPQRNITKENVDWLTKMRKQKLLTLYGTLDKSINALEIQEDSNVKLSSIENKSDVQEMKRIRKKKHATILKYFTIKDQPENV